MRRAMVLVVAVVLLGVAWVALRPDSAPPDQGWALHFSLHVGLAGRDTCGTSHLITGGIATGPADYSGFWTFATQDDAETVASCYANAGGTTDVHETTDAEREQLAYEAQLKKDPCLNAVDKAECRKNLTDREPEIVDQG